jgi:hypothetical protein
MLKSSGGVYPRQHKFDCPSNSSIKVLLHLIVKAGVSRFSVPAYFMVRAGIQKLKHIGNLQSLNPATFEPVNG